MTWFVLAIINLSRGIVIIKIVIENLVYNSLLSYWKNIDQINNTLASLTLKCDNVFTAVYANYIYTFLKAT
jgi:hypothetical protein